MIQCRDCEFYHKDDGGQVSLSCDPFSTIKEPECLTKWNLIKVNQMVEAYHATLGYYRKLAPMQDKLFKVMQRELEDMDEGEKWKSEDEEEDTGDEQWNPEK